MLENIASMYGKRTLQNGLKLLFDGSGGRHVSIFPAKVYNWNRWNSQWTSTAHDNFKPFPNNLFSTIAKNTNSTSPVVSAPITRTSYLGVAVVQLHLLLLQTNAFAA